MASKKALAIFELGQAQLRLAGAIKADGSYVFSKATGVRVVCLADDHESMPCGMEVYGEWTGITSFVDNCHGNRWTAATEGWEDNIVSSMRFARRDGYWVGRVVLLSGTIGEVKESDHQHLTYKAAFFAAACRAGEAHEGWQLLEVKDAK